MNNTKDLAILIVDDEPLVRTGLRAILGELKETCSIVEVFEAEDGKRAVQILSEHRIDIVFTDMKMPNMDGLELLAWISTRTPECKSVVLSCHDDYTYVRNSFRFNVVDYILKYDINKAVVSGVIEKILSDLDKHHVTVSADADPTAAVRAEIEPLRNELSPTSWVTLVLVYTGNYRMSSNLLEPALTSFIGGTTGISCNFIHPKDTGHFLVLETKVPLKDDSTIFPAGRVRDRLSEKTGHRVSLIIGRSGRGCKSITDGIAGIWTGRRKAFFQGPGVYRSSPLPADFPTGHSNEQFTTTKLDLYKYLFDDNIPALKSNLSSFVNHCRKDSSISVDQVQKSCAEFFDLVSVFHRDSLAGRGPEGLVRLRDTIYNAEYFSDIEDVMDELFAELSSTSVTAVGGETVSTGIQRALIYIHTHYGSGTLSLAEVADHLNYSHSYLSRQFKKETGFNVVTYINELRLTEARRLLNTGRHLVYEVAAMVGYNNYNYFSKMYKKKYGASPAKDSNNFDLAVSG